MAKILRAVGVGLLVGLTVTALIFGWFFVLLGLLKAFGPVGGIICASVFSVGLMTGFSYYINE